MLMNEVHVKSVHDAFMQATKLVAALGDKADPSPYCWFRGVNDRSLSLLPGAYWRKDYSEYEPLVSFCQEGGAYAEVGQIDNWDSYYLAQHHGIPTRLLDWTESFAAAMFFALDNWDGKSEPCVWVLSPYLLNKLSIGWKGIIAPNNFPREIGIWLPRQINKPRHSIVKSDGYTYDNRKPLAIYPRKSNARIIAQQGIFTVHGRKKDCLATFIEDHTRRPERLLGRVILSGADVEESRRYLDLLGVRRSTIYPDIDNYVTYLKSVFKW
jgi:FRG domain